MREGSLLTRPRNPAPSGLDTQPKGRGSDSRAAMRAAGARLSGWRAPRGGAAMRRPTRTGGERLDRRVDREEAVPRGRRLVALRAVGGGVGELGGGEDQ